MVKNEYIQRVRLSEQPFYDCLRVTQGGNSEGKQHVNALLLYYFSFRYIVRATSVSQTHALFSCTITYRDVTDTTCSLFRAAVLTLRSGFVIIPIGTITVTLDRIKTASANEKRWLNNLYFPAIKHTRTNGEAYGGDNNNSNNNTIVTTRKTDRVSIRRIALVRINKVESTTVPKS